jgi:hypothetical protein
MDSTKCIVAIPDTGQLPERWSFVERIDTGFILDERNGLEMTSCTQVDRQGFCSESVLGKFIFKAQMN